MGNGRLKMAVRLATLSENTAGDFDVQGEWGLSVLIEVDGQNILLDSGKSGAICQNAEAMGIDLKKIDKIVLSHGHFDHTGGLEALLGKIKKDVPIIAHPDIWAPKYYRRKDKPDRYIGIPFQIRTLESLGARFMLNRDPVRVSESMTTTGEIPMETDFEQIDSNMYLWTPDGWVQDPLADDQALVLDTKQGLVVILGCAHRGIINTLYHARRITGKKKVHMVLGGCHLFDASDERIWQTISALNEMGVRQMAVSHCTGMHASMILSQTYGDNFTFSHTGTIIELT
jgi:7,8-dihydropterin-6-yl-methyl-4-(beta-D-ribofuranosyl)aminobenzene 5'-phosphate synthase